MGEVEEPIIGQACIAKMFGVSRQTICKKKKELLDAGVVWTVKRGRPPRLCYLAFPSVISWYCSYKAKRGEGVLDAPIKK
jgi:hypothetical protein